MNALEGLEVVTLAERPDLEGSLRSLPDAFPEFMHRDAVVGRYWERLFTDLAVFQIADREGGGEIVAAGHCIPVYWDGTIEGLPEGLDGVLERGMEDRDRAPTVVSALIAPVRPTMKDRHPLIPMERYARWERADGLPFDPWLRVHRRLGAESPGVAPRSMVITGTVAEWEGWTGMRLPESGDYVVPEALGPVAIDVERDLGSYTEPNVWMRHPVPGEG